MKQCHGCRRWYPVLEPGEADTEWCVGCIADARDVADEMLDRIGMPPLLRPRPIPPDLALLAGKANRLRREFDRIEIACAEWSGPMQGPIKTFAARRALVLAAVRVGLYALAAALCIVAAWLVSG